MAGTALRRRLIWQIATVITNRPVSDAARRVTLDVADWPGHRPGQHVDVRLTAPDGYQAQRSYSVASAPERPQVDLVVQRVAGGEVSPYLTDELRDGDQIELRGPIGGYFVWHSTSGGPVQLIAGGSGIAPFLAMLEHHEASGSTAALRLLYSARTPSAVIDAHRLDAHARRGVATTITLTRAASPDGVRRRRRVDAQLLADVVWPVPARPQIFVCGPTTFVESVANDLVGLGHTPASIRTERFG
ncbi:FAD-binding oxidoreductase [Egicoccus sp. AB-alg2]|uniref:FAD-binding oxidoreductase n=1 Tax=Egicoccus sp. AB-alg2 TaxID=3242693 RepID=UPI00359EF736